MKLLYRYWKAKRLINQLNKVAFARYEQLDTAYKQLETEKTNHICTIEYMNKRELEQQEELLCVKREHWDLSIKHDELIKRLNENNN